MPILDNAKHELFAQALAEGSTADEAYVRAGYKANRGNAATLKANQSILERVREIVGISAERSGVTVERIVDALASIAFDEDEKSNDRISALEKLGKHLGMFVEQSEVKVVHDISAEPLSLEEWEANAALPSTH